MELRELELYDHSGGESNDKSFLEILSKNDKIIGGEVVNMNSQDIRKFRVVKKKLLLINTENEKLKKENEELKEKIKQLEKELESKGEVKKEEKQIDPEKFGKPKSWQQRTSENLSKK